MCRAQTGPSPTEYTSPLHTSCSVTPVKVKFSPKPEADRIALAGVPSRLSPQERQKLVPAQV